MHSLMSIGRLRIAYQSQNGTAEPKRSPEDDLLTVNIHSLPDPTYYVRASVMMVRELGHPERQFLSIAPCS